MCLLVVKVSLCGWDIEDNVPLHNPYRGSHHCQVRSLNRILPLRLPLGSPSTNTSKVPVRIMEPVMVMKHSSMVLFGDRHDDGRLLWKGHTTITLTITVNKYHHYDSCQKDLFHDFPKNQKINMPGTKTLGADILQRTCFALPEF